MTPKLKIINPATETVLQELDADTRETIARKAEAARRAQPQWAAVPLSERLAAVRRFRDALVAQREPLAATLTSEVGKPIAQARNELTGVLARIDFFLDETEGVLAPEQPLDDAAQGMTERITHEPLGVVANISAWNYPYLVGANVIIPALLAGNAVLYKPSEHATLTGLAIAGLLHEAGVPEDAFIPVVGDGAVGAALLQEPVAGVFFTGSHATGMKVAAAAAARLARVQLELGGKDPVYVCDDVDVAAAAASVADGAFYNTGQSCCSVERVYVHERVHDAFLDAFMETVKGFVLGDPTEERTYIGPITREAHLPYLARQVADAEARGAKLLCGGKRAERRGFYFEPTVLANVDHTMEVMREETFGPVIGIQRVRDDEEALRLMNDTSYGLTAGVYSRDAGRAERLLARANTGSVYWNCCDRVSPRLPWSGRGHSGLGSTLSRAGILAFTQPKAWHLRRPSHP